MSEFTDIGEAVKFVEETKVAALAIMVGTAHGRYKKLQDWILRELQK